MTYNKTPTIKQYIKAKKTILNDMHIKLTSVQMEHSESLKTEGEVDRYVRDFIIGSERE